MKYQPKLVKLFSKIFFVLFVGFSINQNSIELMAQNQEMEEANAIMNGMNQSLKEVNSNIEQVQGAYQQLKDCLSGAGETGSECQRYIDMLYNMEGAGIEVQDEVMTAKQIGNRIIEQFEENNAYQMLSDAANTFGSIGTIVNDSANALEFAQKFNPEGARGDPTRGLRIIGEVIGNAAGSLPYPMDEIFKGYADAVNNVIGKLNDLQNKIEEARQGTLGGSYSGYAAAQEFFDANFASDTRLSIEFFDVTDQFAFLGGDVQVFQNLGSQTTEYFVYKQDTNRGWIAPASFKTLYDYFSVLPPSEKSDIPVAYRPQLLVSQTNSNPDVEIRLAQQLFQTFQEARGQYYMERLLKELELWETMTELLQNETEVFVAFWIFVPGEHSNIQRIASAISEFFIAEGKVEREADTGKKPAPNEPVELIIEGGGSGHTNTNEYGEYFVYARGQMNSNFTIRAGQGDELVEKTAPFYQRMLEIGFVLNKVEQIPVSITVSPSETTIKIGETVEFSLMAIYEDGVTERISEFDGNTYTATEIGTKTVPILYLGLSTSAAITVERDDAQCNQPSEVFDETIGTCVCNTEEGYERNEDLGRCINLDEVLDDITEIEDEAGELCDEEALAASLARLDELVASGSRLAANFQSMLNSFLKEINDQNSTPCLNNITAYTYASAKDMQAEYQVMAEEAGTLSTELMLEGAICPLEELNLDVTNILQKISQFGEPQGQIDEGIVTMENELLSFGCDQQEVSDFGDTIADRSTTPEVIESGAVGSIGNSGGPGLGSDRPGSSTGTFGVVHAIYSGSVFPRSSLNVSVRLNTSNVNLSLSPGNFDYQILESASLKGGDNVQITISGTGLNASINLTESDFIWFDPNTQTHTDPGNGNRIFTITVAVYYDDDEEEMRYRMSVIIGAGGFGYPGSPSGGRTLEY